MATKKLDKKFIQELTNKATLQRRSSFEFKQSKLPYWKQNEDLYYVRESKKYISNRHNAPLPVMSGMLDTFLAKINDTINLQFVPQGNEDQHKAEVVTKLWKHDSNKNYYEQVDRIVKKNAALCGRGIYKTVGTNSPMFCTKLLPVSHYNFHCEPLGGYDLNNHVFCGQDGIYKTPYDLKQGVKNGIYNKQEVDNLIKSSNNEYKEINQDNIDNTNKIKANSLFDSHSYYIGETHFNLTEWYMNYDGKKYYLLFEPNKKICIRCEELKDVLESNKYPFVSFATHPDHTVFWSKSLADDIRPLAIEMRTLLNQTLDNIQKRNWGQRIVDINRLTDYDSLAYRADGVIPVNLQPGESVQTIYNMVETPDTTNATLALMNTLRGMLGQDTGVTAGTQGISDTKAVSVYRGNMMEVADRFKKTGHEYQRAWREIGERYLWAVKQYCSAKDAINILGAEAHDFDEDVINDWKPKLDFIIQLESQEVEKQQVDAQRKLDALALVQQLGPLNVKDAGKHILKTGGGFTEEEAEIILSPEGESDIEIRSDAYRAIQQIQKGKEPKIYQNATSYFLQILYDFATKKCEDINISSKVLLYAQLHANIALENMRRRATMLGTDQVQQMERQRQQNAGVIDTNVVPNATSYNLKSPNNGQ